MTLRMNGVGRTRNIMQREKEREKDSSPHRAKKRNAKKQKQTASLRTNTQTPFSDHQYHGPFAAMPRQSSHELLKQKSRSENKRHAPRKRSTRPGISKLISTPDPHTASRLATAPPQPPLTATTTKTVAKLPPRRLRRLGSVRYETLSRDESQRHETAPHPYPYA